MTPEDIAKAGTESAHQQAVFCWSQQNEHKYPMLRWMYSIPMGGKRNKITAAKMVAEGARKGVWDIFLPYPVTTIQKVSYAICKDLTYHGLYIEMKKAGIGRLTVEQRLFKEYADSVGYKTVVCYGWGEAVAAIID